jgi:Carboxypeptidase regulatory-like domain/TonB-dependent Receptor Plug Domain
MIRRCFPVAICLLFTLVTAHAQSNYAVVRGSILDPQHRPVASAHVRIKSTGTGAQREVAANATGLYEIPALQPGSYELTVESSGFQQSKQTLNLEVGQQATIDVDLRIGTDQQTVTVEAAAGELLKTQDASVGEVVDQRSVDSLPLNGRMLIDLVLTVPGAHISHGASTGDMNPLYWRPGQRSAVSIGGSRPNANYFLLDGATNTDPTFSTQNLSASPDAVQEFQVQTGSYSADMGGAGGGQINIVTRSGTGVFHGTAYEFLRNGAIDAHSFNEMSSGNFLIQNNFGASLGGPVWHAGKTFFFVNYEGLRHVETMTMVDTVPTPQEVSGDFSQSGVNIYDPTTTQPNPNFNPAAPASKTNPQYIRQQFQYNGVPNVIPPGRLTQAASIMLTKYTPQPNSMDMGGMTMMGQPTVVGAGNDANNYLDARKERMTNDQGTFRVDHSFAKGDTAFFRYSGAGEYGFMPEGLPGFGFYHDDLSQQGIVAWNHVFNSHLVNMASGAISRLSMMHTTESANKNDIVTELGIKGTGFGGSAAWGAPYFNIQGFSPLGDSYLATPMHAWDTVIEGRDSLNWQIGRHSAKFGATYQNFIWPMWGFFQNRGYYQFTNGFTTEYGLNDGSTGSSLASFLLGLPAARQGQAGVPQMDLRQWYADGYAQDAWRLTSNTTLTYGVRYEFMSPLVDIRYTNSNLDLRSGTPQVFIGGQNGYPRGLMYANHANFAPRLGLAQSFPRLGLVAHVAYGIFYTPVDMNTWCNQRHNVPYVFPLTSQSDPFLPSITTLNFPTPVLGTSVVSFTSLQLHAPAQYIQQWSTSIEKQLGRETTLEFGYLGAGGFHLQRSHLINNAQPGPGLIQPRRPHPKISFVANSVFPAGVTVTSSTFPVSTINLLENTAQSWYDAGYVNVRRRYESGLSFLANYTFAKSLENAPDFRSPMFEAATPQNNDDLNAEKGPGCDIRHRFALSAVYSPKAYGRNSVTRAITRDWRGSIEYQAQTGFPMTISVFGDTANAGTVVGENPIRANVTGKPVFGSGTRNSTTWFNPAAFVAPPAYTYGNAGRNSVYGPGLQTMDVGIVREFSLAEKARFEMRGEFFNAFNHTNLGTPNRFVNTASFGSITEVATPGREIQVSARLSF